MGNSEDKHIIEYGELKTKQEIAKKELSQNQYLDIKEKGEQTPEMAARYSAEHRALDNLHNSQIKKLQERQLKEKDNKDFDRV